MIIPRILSGFYPDFPSNIADFDKRLFFRQECISKPVDRFDISGIFTGVLQLAPQFCDYGSNIPVFIEPYAPHRLTDLIS